WRGRGNNRQSNVSAARYLLHDLDYSIDRDSLDLLCQQEQDWLRDQGDKERGGRCELCRGQPSYSETDWVHARWAFRRFRGSSLRMVHFRRDRGTSIRLHVL